jgi:hypothetical protein
MPSIPDMTCRAVNGLCAEICTRLAHVSKPCARLIVCALATLDGLEERACHIGAQAGSLPVEETKTISQSLYGADPVLGSREVSVDDAKRG